MLLRGPQTTGPVDGLQAQYTRVPYANIGPVWAPDEVSDEQAILLSDIHPTARFGCCLAESGRATPCSCSAPVRSASSRSRARSGRGAGRVLCIDGVQSRLEQARARGAEVVDFTSEDPVAVVQELTAGIGVDRVVDAVGVDAQRPERAPRRSRPSSSQGPSTRSAHRSRRSSNAVSRDAGPAGLRQGR